MQFFNLTVLPDLLLVRNICVIIAIIEDNLVERNEDFYIILTSVDSSVIITRMRSSVLIIDTTSKGF